ncbi:Crp/Fnr family transcriptional regulator [Methyloferula stellata]|uniref:Crp/Fnr family transcriptional regulator n=1 Tax=Methyloferula stellata TaxID=876270 RepID=UPI000366A99A|nr:Crp/Fnr family transcriptional regulator [Methyloferula stellata]
MAEEPASFFDLHRLLNLSGTIGDVRLLKNQALFAQGDPADAVYYILEGKIKVTVVSKHRKQAVIAILEAGSFCGEGCLATEFRTTSAVAMTACVVVRMEKNAVMGALHEDQEFSNQFATYLLTRNARLEQDLVDHLVNPSEKRLARLLLILGKFGKGGNRDAVLPEISQEMLAEMIGTTRSRVSHFMNKFRQKGFIDYNSHIQVHKSLLNALLHGDIGKPEDD